MRWGQPAELPEVSAAPWLDPAAQSHTQKQRDQRHVRKITVKLPTEP